MRPENPRAVSDEIARVEATAAHSFSGSIDRDRASTADTQGIGGPGRLLETRPATAVEALEREFPPIWLMRVDVPGAEMIDRGVRGEGRSSVMNSNDSQQNWREHVDEY